MSSLRSCFVLIIVLACMCLTDSSYGRWKKIAVIPASEGEVHCGFFFDELNGLIGTGSWGQATNFFIRRTTDGGKTWTVSTTPLGKGLVTSIFMKDPLTGYASITYLDPTRTYSVMKTTDGGITWNDDSHGNSVPSTSIYATSKALIKTEWDNNEEGAFSLDDGITFASIASDSDAFGNGIDFADDMTGVIVFYGSDAENSFSSLSTSDGGVTWNRSLDSIPEAWSVYAVKGTQTFVALPEGQLSDPSNIVYWSQNGGMNWQERATLPDAGFTGHIAGVGNTIYVQSLAGFYRSDDLGLTWRNVGGPPNDRDTRFVVTGCKGQVVYAFDGGGYIYKTTDGGDSTLLIGGNNTLLSVLEDTIRMQMLLCQPARNYFHLTNATCNSTVILDSVTFTPNPYNEFSVDTVIRGISLGSTDNGFGIPIIFQSDSNITRQTLIRIQAHGGAQTFDTTIILFARQSIAPDPYVGAPHPAKADSIALIPIFLRPTQDNFRITHCVFHLSYDGDVLTPSINPVEVIGTLSATAIVSLNSSTANGAEYDVDFTSPVTQASDLTLPIIYARMNVTLSSHLFSPIRLDTFSFAGGKQPLGLLQMCQIPETTFFVDQECGDTTISSFMLTGKIPGITSVHPNPNTGTVIEAEIYLPHENDLNFEILDASGRSSQKVFLWQHYASGNHTIPINTSSLSSGTYILRMKTGDGSVTNQEIIVQR